jgi:hypothetical protein
VDSRLRPAGMTGKNNRLVILGLDPGIQSFYNLKMTPKKGDLS